MIRSTEERTARKAAAPTGVVLLVENVASDRSSDVSSGSICVTGDFRGRA
jgi:hypothetical protein